jgi:hypothetical protein
MKLPRIYLAAAFPLNGYNELAGNALVTPDVPEVDPKIFK